MRRRSFITAVAASGTSGFAQTPRRLRIGVTAVMLSGQAAFLARWARYLSKRTDAQVSFVVRDQYRSVIELMAAGQVEAAWLCGYPFVRQQASLQLLAVPLYRGEPHYQSYLIRPKDNGSVRGWADLRGRVLAYSDPLSNSGWLVAQAELGAAGLTPADLRGSFFAHGHRNVADAVGAKLADAGAIDGYIWDTMQKLRMPAAAQTEVVWRSRPFGFPPLVAPATLAPQHIAPLRTALLTMNEDGVGQQLLAELNLNGFVPGSPSLYESIRQMAQTVAGAGVPA